MTCVRVEPGGISKRKGTRDVKNLSLRFIFVHKNTHCSILSFRVFTRFARPACGVYAFRVKRGMEKWMGRKKPLIGLLGTVKERSSKSFSYRCRRCCRKHGAPNDGLFV